MAQRKNIVFALLFGGAIVVSLAVIFFYVFVALMTDRDVSIGDAVAVVDITGELVYDRDKIAEIDGYRENDRIKAVVLFINSPGGGVAASQELYHAVRKLREKKPVVASMGATAASGGYYVACAADSIMALEGTITGSIGVVATFLRTEELYHKIGLDVTVIKSGKYKDVGSPYRKMSEEEKQYMGALLDRVYNQFVDAVCEGRHLPREEVMGLAEGRIYSGEEAAENGLIDRIGSFDDAVQMATDMGNIHGKARIVKRRKRPDFLERLLGERVAGLARGSTDQRMALKYIIP